jgi:hypothetical protein
VPDHCCPCCYGTGRDARTMLYTPVIRLTQLIVCISNVTVTKEPAGSVSEADQSALQEGSRDEGYG